MSRRYSGVRAWSGCDVAGSLPRRLAAGGLRSDDSDDTLIAAERANW